jgi:hypothetical protein
MSEFRSFFPHRWADVLREEYDSYERYRDILWEREMAISESHTEPEIRSGLLTVDTDEMKKLFAK